MKPPIRLLCLSFMLLGLIIGAAADRAGQTMRWQVEAYCHHCAVWRENYHNGKVKWQWLDDYFMEEYSKARTPKAESAKDDRL